MPTLPKLRAPFPYFGGKMRAAELVWAGLGAGDCAGYVEPFFGSGAVLLARPEFPAVYSETVCDASGHLTNFWRSVQNAPDEVARWAMVPIDHLELQARKRWQLDQYDRVKKLAESVDHYDARAAGYWVYGTCGTIGDGWESAKVSTAIPAIGDYGRGLYSATSDGAVARLRQLAARLARTRIVCGDWTRVCGNSVLDPGRSGSDSGVISGVYLDPPYPAGNQQYGAGGTGSSLWQSASDWAAKTAADKPWVRIALSGYSGHGTPPAGWSEVRWKAAGGHAATQASRKNRGLECIWFSPSCVQKAGN